MAVRGVRLAVVLAIVNIGNFQVPVVFVFGLLFLIFPFPFSFLFAICLCLCFCLLLLLRDYVLKMPSVCFVTFVL
jgi:hypothetical protein